MTNGPTAGHSQREYQQIVLHPSGRAHPEQTALVCEAPGCSQVVTIANSYSFVVCMATTGPAPRPESFQCGDEQHFCCSPACARAAALACMDHQIEQLELRRVQLAAEGTPDGNQ